MEKQEEERKKDMDESVTIPVQNDDKIKDASKKNTTFERGMPTDTDPLSWIRCKDPRPYINSLFGCFAERPDITDEEARMFMVLNINFHALPIVDAGEVYAILANFHSSKYERTYGMFFTGTIGLEIGRPDSSRMEHFVKLCVQEFERCGRFLPSWLRVRSHPLIETYQEKCRKCNSNVQQ
jgi:hypothetical protein